MNSNLIAIVALELVALIGGGFRVYLNIVKKLNRIEYALFNGGHGVVQQVSDLHDNQATIMTDIAIMKATKSPRARSTK